MSPTYLDASRPHEERIDDLLARMTLAEKAGQMFHTMAIVGPGGSVTGPVDALGLPSPRAMIDARHMTHFNMVGNGTAEELATWTNSLQEIADGTRLRIPVTISSDPRHGFTRNLGTSDSTTAFSSWPEPLGLAAIGDVDLVEQFARICREEYLAVGIRVALHPQLDVATEPRWARIIGTFGEDPDLVARLGAAYVRGLQDDRLGADSVAAMVKHFPGGGPLRDGEDSHFPTGREQIYPGGRFDDHLRPFRSALDAGAGQVMPSYGMPVGLDVEEVAFGFNRDVVTGLLRERLGFDGVVCTDWGLLTDAVLLGQAMPARAWGVEHLAPAERAVKALDAGVDQFGGEHCPELIVDAVRNGAIDEARIDRSVRRILRAKFELGLFEHRYVDAGRATVIAGRREFRDSGRTAQSASVTVLTNRDVGGSPVLPLSADARIHVDGLDPTVAASYCRVVEDPADADVVIRRIAAPYEPRPGGFESMFHAGSLDYAPDTAEAILDGLRLVPTVLDVHLDRPAILTEFVDDAAAIVASFGCGDRALLDALFGIVAPIGRLPVDLPRSMGAVRAAKTDTPFDMPDPLFRHGHGLTI